MCHSIGFIVWRIFIYLLIIKQFHLLMDLDRIGPEWFILVKGLYWQKLKFLSTNFTI